MAHFLSAVSFVRSLARSLSPKASSIDCTDSSWPETHRRHFLNEISTKLIVRPTATSSPRCQLIARGQPEGAFESRAAGSGRAAQQTTAPSQCSSPLDDSQLLATGHSSLLGGQINFANSPSATQLASSAGLICECPARQRWSFEASDWTTKQRLHSVPLAHRGPFGPARQ